jgi:hypothetical protein
MSLDFHQHIDISEYPSGGIDITESGHLGGEEDTSVATGELSIFAGG